MSGKSIFTGRNGSRIRKAVFAVAVALPLLGVSAKSTLDEMPGTNVIYSAGEVDDQFSDAKSTNEIVYAKHAFALGDPFGVSHRGLAYYFVATNPLWRAYMPVTNIVYVDAVATNRYGYYEGPCLTSEGARAVFGGFITVSTDPSLIQVGSSTGKVALVGLEIRNIGDQVPAYRIPSADILWQNVLPHETIGNGDQFVSADLGVYNRSRTLFSGATLFGTHPTVVQVADDPDMYQVIYYLRFGDLNDMYNIIYKGEQLDESGNENVRVFTLDTTQTNQLYAVYPQTFTATNAITTNHVGRLAMTNDFSSIGRICNPSNEVDASGNFWRIDETWEVARSNGAQVVVELYRESENLWSYGEGTGYWRLEYGSGGWMFMPEMSDERPAVPRFKKDADVLYSRMATNDFVNNYVLTRNRRRTFIGKFRVGEDAGWVTTQGVERIVASATNAVPRIVSTENLSYLSADLKYVPGKDWNITRIVMYSGYEVVSNNAKTVWYRQTGSEDIIAYALTIFWGPDVSPGNEKAWYVSDGGSPSLISYDTTLTTFSDGPWNVMNVTYSRDITKVATTNELSALQRVVSARVSDDAKTLYLTNSTGGAEIAFQGGGGGGGGITTNAVKSLINDETGGTNTLAHASDIAAATNAIPRGYITDGTNTVKASRETVMVYSAPRVGKWTMTLGESSFDFNPSSTYLWEGATGHVSESGQYWIFSVNAMPDISRNKDDYSTFEDGGWTFTYTPRIVTTLLATTNELASAVSATNSAFSNSVLTVANNLLMGQSFDLSDSQGLTNAVKALVQALGGSVSP